MSQPPPPAAGGFQAKHGLGLGALIVLGLIYALLHGPAQPPSQPPANQSSPPVATQAPAPQRRAAAAPSVIGSAIPVADGAAIDDPDEVSEIRRTLSAMRRGPPYPFHADDGTWENREHRLPEHPMGWWREFTVVTPGEHDRSTRRIVAGKDGALYFTRDHYHTFVRLDVPDPREALRN